MMRARRSTEARISLLKVLDAIDALQNVLGLNLATTLDQSYNRLFGGPFSTNAFALIARLPTHVGLVTLTVPEQQWTREESAIA